MQAIFNVTLPFFALVLCGYLAANSKVLPQSAIPGLNAYVLFFALPCMLFNFGRNTPIAQLFDPALLAIWAICALMMVFITVRFLMSAAVSLKDSAFAALVATFPNTGFMGVPLMVALLGERAAGPMILTILVDIFMTSSLCIALAQSQGAAGGGEALKKALRGTLVNPLPWAIALGAVFSAGQLDLPGPVAQIVRMLGDSATPVAMFTIGAVLWRSNQAVHGRTPLGQFGPVVLIKLLAHPLLVLSVGLILLKAGLAIDHFALSVLVMTAALPSASNVSLLAERYGADAGRVARVILWSTVASFITFSITVQLFGGRTT